MSAGLLMYRWRDRCLEVFLAHPGGPFFKRKDRGVWTIPKGLPAAGEELQAAAIREFVEETGLSVSGVLLDLGSVRQKSGKRVQAWAFEGTLPADFVLESNEFEMEWPPKSGRRERFAEVDRAEFFAFDTALDKIIAAQVPLLERLRAQLTARAP